MGAGGVDDDTGRNELASLRRPELELEPPFGQGRRADKPGV